MKVILYSGWLALLLVAAAVNPPVIQAAETKDLKTSGGLDVGFGILDQESTGGFKKLEAAGKGRLNFAATLGEFEAEAEIGIIDDGNVDYTRHAVRWKPNEGTTVTLSGSAFGVPGVDGFLGVVAGKGVGILGDLDVYFDYKSAGLFNLNFDAGGLILGVAVSDTCVPECGTDGGGGGGGAGADEERNTIILTLQSKPDAFRYQVYAVSSTGTHSAGLEEGKGRGFGLSLGYKGDDMEVMSDASSGTTVCDPAVGCTEDVETSNFGVALKAGGIGLQYVSLTTEIGAAKRENTGTDVVYHFKSGDVTYGPQYSQEKFDDGTAAVTDSFLYFAISMVF